MNRGICQRNRLVLSSTGTKVHPGSISEVNGLTVLATDRQIFSGGSSSQSYGDENRWVKWYMVKSRRPQLPVKKSKDVQKKRHGFTLETEGYSKSGKAVLGMN